jgi:8-oxo-dGTP pyrophosphatase MutT (NUDIX family)
VAAAIRETLEETGYHVVPTALVGIYRWQTPVTGATFIRFRVSPPTLVGHEPHARSTREFLRAFWLSYDDLIASRDQHTKPARPAVRR